MANFQSQPLPRVLAATCGGILIALAIAACGGDKSTGPVRDGFAGVIDEAGDYLNPTDEGETLGPETPLADSTASDGTIWSCTTRRVSLVEAPEELFLYQESGRVYPGALVQGGSLERDPPDAILLPRGPGRVAINLTTGEGDSTFIDVPEMSSSLVGNAINDLVRGRTFLPQVLTVESRNIRSQEELDVAMKLTYSGFGQSGAAQWSFRQDSQYTRRLVRIVQKFFDVRFERPFDPAEWFAPSVTVEDFRRFAGPGNPPVYINQVTYGRVIFVLIETRADSTATDLAIQANYKALGGNGSVDTQTAWTGALEDVQLRAAVYGGSESVALQALFESRDAVAFNQAVGKLLIDQDIQTGLPISYGMRDVRNDRTVKVKLATEYDLRNCTPIATALSNPIARWEVTDPMDGPATTYHPASTRTGFKIYGSFLDEMADAYWNDAGDVCLNPDGNRPCEAACVGLPTDKSWDEGVIRTSATSPLVGDPLCADGWPLSNHSLVMDIVNDLGTGDLSQLDPDKAPTLIDYAANLNLGKVVQFHTWPDTSRKSWANQAAPGSPPLGATDGRYGVLPRYAFGSMDFDGNLLANKYYTVFLVLQSPNEIYAKNWVCSQSADCGGGKCWQYCLNRFNNRRGSVLLGSDRANELRMGFNATGDFIVRHRVNNVEHSLSENGAAATDGQWHIYAVAFGPDGTRIYVDGILSAEDPAMNTPITGFRGAHFGSEPIGGGFTSVVRWKLAEFYEGAGTDMAIKAQSDTLQSRFGL